MRRRPWLLAAALLLGACAQTEDSQSIAFLKDARECEMDADAQLKTVSEPDRGIRMLLLQSCMALRGWPQ